MSGLEATIWSMLGYLSMPLVMVVGYLATAYLSCFLLETFGKKDD